MADADRELLNEVVIGTDVMARLARDEETFRAAVDAFRAQDGESMHRLLERHNLADRCEIVCHWLRSKEAVLLCLELAGVPQLDEGDEPDVRQFAEIVGRLTADEEMVELMADAVQERDSSAWRELIERNNLERFSHLLCHWVSTVHYRLVCDVVCQPIRVARPHLIPELRAAGQAIATLAANQEVFAEAEKAVRTGSCESLAATLESSSFLPFCFFICEWFCSWRCLLLCFRLCRAFPIEEIESQVGEMLEFARAGGRIAAEKGTVERLTAAMLREDVEVVDSIVKELEFGRFCVQFCHWVCFLRCQHFCFCVCPPRTIGVFTKIGGLYYETAIHSHDPGNGLTVSDNRAFYSTLRLNGGLSVVDGAPLIEYRFQTIPTTATGTPIGGTWQPVGPGQIASTNIGSFVRPTGLPSPFPPLDILEVWVNNPSPSVFNITPSADGWIKVPPFTPVPPMVPGLGWRFVPGSDLIEFMTTTLTPFVATIDETGVIAGNSANAPLQTDVHYGIRMMIRDQGTTGDGTFAGTCGHIAINNTLYDNVSHHPYWPGGLFGATNELAVASLGIAELAAAPCSDLSASLTVKFTAAHSNLGAVTVTLEGPGPAKPFTLNPPAAEDAGENWYGTADPDGWTFDELPPCAYLLNLYVQVLLTTGDSVPTDRHDYIAFCKGATKM